MEKPVSNVSNLAIHLISKHAEIEKVKAIQSPMKFIELLVKTYNQKKPDKADHFFKPIEGFVWNREGHENFHLAAYYSRRSHTCSSGLFVEKHIQNNQERFDNMTVHFAFFVYFSVKSVKQKETEEKTNEVWALFALTSNQAYRLIRPYCDYGFPTRIAFRIVVPEFIKKEVTPLVGTKEATSSHYKKPYQLRFHEYDNLWVLYKNFDAELKAGCSLTPLLCEKKNKQIGIHIGEGMIRLTGSYPFDCIVAILPTLFNIRKGLVTYDAQKKPELDDESFLAFANIQRVNSKLAKQLDAGMISILYRYLNDDNSSSALYLSHTHYHQYYTSSSFVLKVRWKGAKYQTIWHYPPSIHQLIETLRISFQKSSLEDFAKRIDQTTMQCDGIGPTSHPLIHFIQGEFFYEGDIYFKVGGVWLKVLNQHLATTERSFIKLLEQCLVTEKNKKGHLLPDQWISKEDWIAFSLTEFPSKPTDQTLKELKAAQFSFIDSKGKVLLPYPTRALFTDQKTPIIKSLKKKWAELEEWLNNHLKNSVTEKDLGSIFPERASEIFKLLTASYPVLRSLQKKEGKIAAIGENGTVQVTDLSQFQTIKGTQKYISNNFTELSKLLSSQESLEEDDLETIQPNENYRKETFKWLQTKHSLKPLASERLVAQGPIPENISMEQVLREFLEKKHQDYRLVMDEEHYSRLFLNRPDYLVCDQVFPGKRDHVELCDLLYFGDKGKLYLYAIKEGFGTSTGIACTQIRVAAETIEAARRSGSDILGKLYDAATTTNATTDFRKKLAADINNLGKKEFVELFKEREIIFVYAFLDTGQEDHRLEDELECQPIIKKELFTDITTDPQSLLDFLVAIGFLDESYRLTDAFLGIPSTKFKNSCQTFIQNIFQALQSYTKIPEAIRSLSLPDTITQAVQSLLNKKGYGSTEKVIKGKLTTLLDFQKDLISFDFEKVSKLLWGQVSQFDSMIAKIELIKLKKEIAHKGFQLQIVQLNRPGKRRSQPTLNVIDHSSLAPSTFHSEKAPKPESTLPLILPIKDKNQQHYISKEAGPPALDTDTEITQSFKDLKGLKLSPRGISNQGNDCFLNATMQLLIHSPIYDFLIEKRRETHPFFRDFARFALKYSLEAPQELQTEYMRSSLHFPRETQEDAAEALEKMLEAFDLEEILPSFTIERNIDTENASPCVATDPTPLDELTSSQETLLLIKLPIPEGKPSLANSCDLLFQPQKTDASIVYQKNGESFKAEGFTEKYTLNSPPKVLFIQLKRFSGTKKIETIIQVNEKITINKTVYTVVGFINHVGQSSNMGHYTATVKVKNTWHHFDDEKATKEEDFLAVQGRANTAYLLMLHRT